MEWDHEVQLPPMGKGHSPPPLRCISSLSSKIDLLVKSKVYVV